MEIAVSTQCSQAVSHPSTDRARHCLTSLIKIRVLMQRATAANDTESSLAQYMKFINAYSMDLLQAVARHRDGGDPHRVGDGSPRADVVQQRQGLLFSFTFLPPSLSSLALTESLARRSMLGRVTRPPRLLDVVSSQYTQFRHSYPDIPSGFGQEMYRVTMRPCDKLSMITKR